MAIVQIVVKSSIYIYNIVVNTAIIYLLVSMIKSCINLPYNYVICFLLGNYPKENILHIERRESLKSRTPLQLVFVTANYAAFNHNNKNYVITLLAAILYIYIYVCVCV